MNIINLLQIKPCVKLSTLLFIATLLSIPNAFAYNLPANIGTSPFNNCSLSSGTTYNCSGDISLGNNGTINVTSPVTLNLTSGSFNAGNGLTITSNGYEFNINVLDDGEDVDIGTNFTGNVNFTANDRIRFGNNASVVGNLTADRLDLNNNTTVTGYCSPSNSKCTAPPAPVQIAEFRMNESVWSGTTGEVLDSIGSYSSRASSLSATKPTTANTSPAITGSPGTCRYGVFNRTNKDYVALPSSFPNMGANGNAFTITAWIRTTNNTLPGQRIFVDDENNSGGFGFSIGDENATGRLRFFSRGTPSALSLDTGNVIANNTWYFVAAVADIPNKRKLIYIFNTSGTLLTNVSATWTESAFGSDNGIASIGGETNASGEGNNNFGFAGNIDELKVFQSALNSSQLNAVRQDTNACATLDHVRLSHAGSGLTCTASIVTVNACNSFDTANSCTANTNGLSGSVIAKSASGTILTTVPFTIPVGSSATTINVPVTSAQTVTFETSNLSVTPANLWTCWNGSTSSCSHTYNDSGFIFDVPHHIAETTQTVNVSAVRKSNNTLACTPAFANTSKSVNFKCSYNNPVVGTLPVRINNTPLNAANSTSAACDMTGRNISLTFNASGVANTSFQYADTGDILLNATYTGAGTDAGLSMTGSDNFTSAPKDFVFSNTTTAPIKAGNNFNTTVTARNALNATTPNFGRESTPETAELTFSKCQPTGVNAASGSFTGSLGSFTNGVATASNLKWSEVGNGDITATLDSGSYLGSGINVTGNTGTSGTVCSGTGNVGRFIPDHFDTIVTQGCNAGGFTYSAQPFNLQVKAMNASGNITQNYDGTANTTPNFSKSTTLSDGNAVTSGSLLNNSVAAAAYSQGTANATPSFIFSSALTSPSTITLRAIDTDAVSSLRAVVSSSIEGSTLVRSGRMRLQNAYGSELLDLPMSLIAQYWSNGSWVLNSSDLCTTGISLAFADPNTGDGLIPSELCVLDTGSPGNSGLGCSTAGSVAKRFKEPPENGNFNLTLKAPGSGNSGTMNVTATVPNWLKYNWTGSGITNPSARATFGIYKTPIIYIRENY
ncbi:DUF6701 domain-containing protein [Methylotenera mobilis]|jgi:MSHA biogenesis protein MshQ|uniref:DUF6701 domain-containing protein n=1 Tax=Methylotenera mobilis TaxID=359408 RepID=UPI00037A2EEF|nr:DUF6701 domain-containing protein [Methylotenera mobilis]